MLLLGREARIETVWGAKVPGARVDQEVDTRQAGQPEEDSEMTDETLAMVKGFKILAEAFLDGSGLGTPEGMRAYKSSLRHAVVRAETIIAKEKP